MEEVMPVLVVDASGAVGGAVVAGLLERGAAVRANSRTPEKLSLPEQVQVFGADLDDPTSFAAALESVDRVFLYADLAEPEALLAVIALTAETLIGEKPVLTGPARLTLREQVTTIGEVIGRRVSVIEQTEAESSALLSRHAPDEWVRQIIKDWREAVGATPVISDE
ncbi:NAD(P)H-binding protein [Desertihabitans brevis]|uniref:NAD(P)H-binding protein n=1 Tax=Desertihabitans brevis TaxID=2268447 RepID=UPI0018F3FCA1|nr:NAD(P)H-binding protein [Desertihabitans brevis]